jgi:hypothetical protein
MKCGQGFVSLCVGRVVKLNIKPGAGVNRALRVLSCGAVRVFAAFCLIAALSLCSASRAGAQVCHAPCQQYSNASLHGAIDLPSLSTTLNGVAAGDTIIVPINWGPGNASAPNCASVEVTDNATGGSNTYVVDKVVYPVYWPNSSYPFCFAQFHTLGGVHGSPTIITATVSPAARQEINVTAVDFAGILTSGDPVDVSVTQQQARTNDTGYTANPSLTTATNGEILVESMGFSEGAPGPPSSGWNTCDPKISTMCNWRVATSAGSYSASYGANGAQQWVTILTAYKVADSGTSPVTSPEITVAPSSVNFGSENVGGKYSTPITLTSSGNSSVTISSISTSGAGFGATGVANQTVLNPGQSVQLNAIYEPTTAGTSSGEITIASNSATPATIALSGTAQNAQTASPEITVTPSSASFGNVPVGTSISLTIQIHNNGTSRLTLGPLILSGAGFNLANVPPDLLMAANTSSTFNVVFTPSSAGIYSGSLPLIANGVTVGSIPLSGTGTGSGTSPATPPVTPPITPPVTSSGITVTPSSVSFGSVPSGSSISQTIQVHNNGTTRVTLGSLTLSGPGFKLANVPSDLLMAANTSSTFSVVFSPSSAGTYSGSLAIIVKGVTVGSIPLSGTGTGSSAGSGISPVTPPVTSPGTTVTPSSVSFGSAAVGSSISHTIQVHNNGTTRITLGLLTLSGPGFKLANVPSDLLMAANTSLTFNVVFSPSSAGTYSGSLAIIVKGVTVGSIPLSGTGTP